MVSEIGRVGRRAVQTSVHFAAVLSWMCVRSFFVGIVVVFGGFRCVRCVAMSRKYIPGYS